MGRFKINDENKGILENLTAEMSTQMEIFSKNNALFMAKGNRQASKRARVASLHLFKATKAYRAESMRILSTQTT